MDWRATMPAGRARPVSVEIGQQRARKERRAPPAVCIVAICDQSQPWISDKLPNAIVRQSRFEGQDTGAEQLRLKARVGIDALPGLDDPFRPSLVRDTARLVMAGGAGSVDVLFGRHEGAKPWEFDNSRIRDAIQTYIADMAGTTLLFPDLNGPISVGPGTGADPADVVNRVRTFLDLYSEGFADAYQVALLDMPPVSDINELDRVLDRMAGRDVSLCQWVGNEHALRSQGWRSPASAVAGLIALGEKKPVYGLSGRRVPLLPGRRYVRSRSSTLALPRPPALEHPRARLLTQLEISSDLSSATIQSEPVLRRPVGTWTLSAVRMAKTVNRQIYQTASNFVFQPAHPRQAMALTAALQFSLRPYVRAGLLTSTDGEGEPVVSGKVERLFQPGRSDPGYSLVADIAAMLKPWSRRVVVRVSLRPGSEPTLETSS